MKKTTTIDLVNALTKRNVDGKYDKIIERAKDNGYHDFKFEQSGKYPDCICPKVELVEDLSVFPELEDVRSDVMNGVYDESPDEQDKEVMRGWLKEDGDKGDAMAKVLGL
jgi:hypothetical protein